MKKQTIRLILRVIMIATLLVLASLSVSATDVYQDDNFNYIVVDGEATIVGYKDSSTEKIIIPEVLGGYKVKEIGSKAFYSYENLKSVVIPNTVEIIGAEAFCYCVDLESVSIPCGVKKIGGYAFAGCKKLNNVELSDSIERIKDNAFYYSGYYLNEDNWEDGILYIGNHLIEANKEVENITIKKSTKSIAEWAFGNNDKLSYIEVPEGISIINEATFYGCSNLKAIVLYDSITKISDFAFTHCDNLTDIYYTGSQEQWNLIEINYFNMMNDEIKNANKHYNYDPNHVHLYSKIIKTSPTCITQGYTTYTCSCGDSYVDSYMPVVAHKDENSDYKCDFNCGYEFKKPAPEVPNTSETSNEPLTFFEKIAKWFRDLFDKLFGWLK